MFIIPFVFAFYPEILLIEDAVIDAGSNSGGAIKYLAGYTGTVDLGVLAMLLFRLAIALYLVSSSLSRFDSGPLGFIEVVLRIGLAMLLLFKSPVIFSFAIVGAVLVIGVHQLRHRGIIGY
jgi:TRAP-type uncharacterized transport system fused permease subunit